MTIFVNDMEKDAFFNSFGHAPVSCVRIAGDGSNRQYFRLTDADGRTAIGVEGTNIRENEAFIYFTELFSAHNLPVPQLIAVDADTKRYIQSDLGNVSLYSLIASRGLDDSEVQQLIFDTVAELPKFQHIGAENVDASKCFPRPAMDERASMWDLNYFKYAFLKPLEVEFDEDLLQDDFEQLATIVSRNPNNTLMLRDFQSRNIMIYNDRPFVIDYQGARLGDGIYDLVSFVYQARAGFSKELKQKLIEHYYKCASCIADIDRDDFNKRVGVMALFRLLQTLGAYGFRGYVQHKAMFLSSIGPAIGNLREMVSQWPFGQELTYLRAVLDRLVSLKRFVEDEPVDGLTVKVMSFSYKKGIPEDTSGNGGGFVFDCRAPHNPGRYEPYKKLTGRDEAVIEFLERDGEMPTLVENAYKVVDPAVERYIERGFTNLMVCFGCTGGQHRSVYGAEHMARHLHEKYGVRVRLIHREQGINQIFDPK